MLISSITSTFVAFQRFRLLRFLVTFFPSSSALSLASPQPEKAWMVVPDSRVAAAPVDAVTATASGLCLYLSAPMIDLRSVDFPVPAFPVKKRDSPLSARCSTACCSSDSTTPSSLLGTFAPNRPPPLKTGGLRSLDAEDAVSSAVKCIRFFCGASNDEDDEDDARCIMEVNALFAAGLQMLPPPPCRKPPPPPPLPLLPPHPLLPLCLKEWSAVVASGATMLGGCSKLCWGRCLEEFC
mmetsp:Transcript_36172/g.71653  ORF Transcript_36172/g.71653 Transcript_36172/m.71653 type:complete len:239 (-) Transcript_36172:163-879(-)